MRKFFPLCADKKHSICLFIVKYMDFLEFSNPASKFENWDVFKIINKYS